MRLQATLAAMHVVRSCFFINWYFKSQFFASQDAKYPNISSSIKRNCFYKFIYMLCRPNYSYFILDPKVFATSSPIKNLSIVGTLVPLTFEPSNIIL